MSIENSPSILCEMTFLTSEENGRQNSFSPGALNGCKYRPHIVMGDPNQRIAIVEDGNKLIEEYLGVCFYQCPESVELGEKFTGLLKLPYYPELQYEKVVENASFTIREGGKIVGFGTVLEVSGI